MTAMMISEKAMMISEYSQLTFKASRVVNDSLNDR